MSQQLIRDIENQFLKDEPPQFDIGDTVGVHVRISEGGKQRVQVFTGTVIGRRGSGINEKVTVRRIVAGEGVERVFPLHSPQISKIEVVRSGQIRRAKLYFLRERVGKATRLKERRVKRNVRVAGEETVAARQAREAEEEAKIRAAEEAEEAKRKAEQEAAEKAETEKAAAKAEAAEAEAPAEEAAEETPAAESAAAEAGDAEQAEGEAEKTEA